VNPPGEQRQIALQPVVLEALKLLRATLPATIEIRTTVPPENHLVRADATQVHQVVLNLCTNAAHAMQERGGILDVSCDAVMLDAPLAQEAPGLKLGHYLRLTIRDTGHGMDRPTLDRIFDPFFTTKQPGEGTGLGLAVVHGIMQSHHGAVTVESEPGSGTGFRVFFPIVEGHFTPAIDEKRPLPARRRAAPAGRGR
jgi:signal transduction histidine kinase